MNKIRCRWCFESIKLSSLKATLICVEVGFQKESIALLITPMAEAKLSYIYCYANSFLSF